MRDETVDDGSVSLEKIKDPEIFLALNKVCKYLINSAWTSIVWGDPETEYEFGHAVAKSKRYQKDIEILANMDSSLRWGEIARRRKGGFVSTKAGYDNYNPWYEGNMSLKDFLESIEELVDFSAGELNMNVDDTEFQHYYHFLLTKVLSKFPKPTFINFHTLHPKIQKHCAKRFNSGNYADAILAAYKVVFNEIKDITGINDLDGKPLAEKTFSLLSPIIKLNKLVTQSERDEQLGFMMLFAGSALGIRNPKAHDLLDQDDKEKALRYLSFASLLLERLDSRYSPNS